MRRIKLMLAMFVMGIMYPLVSFAQIGYQVSLLNASTGEPRANVSVEAEVTITNSDDEEIYKGTQRATSNDFGVIQLTVGNQSTFKDVDWSKLPFFIEVSVDGTVIGKSQILTVPIAEAAKKLVPAITPEDLKGAWSEQRKEYVEPVYTFNIDYTGYDKDEAESFTYQIEGNNVLVYESDKTLLYFRYHEGLLYRIDNGRSYSK